jgi:dTDP-4-dehydrorhamnose reductase
LKALVVGASGHVGRYLVREFAAAMETVGTYCHHREAGLLHLDIADPTQCGKLLRAEGPTHVVLAGAATHVDWCEDNAAACYAVNVEGVRNVTKVARELGSHVVLMSTDQVFGDSERPHREDDPVAPVNVYAKSKAFGEAVVRHSLPHAHHIIRTAWVYGNDRQGKNFVMALCRRIAAGECVPVPEDQWGNPTYAHDVARATLALVRGGESGTCHVTGPACMSRFDFAGEVCRAFQLPERTIRPVKTERLGQRAPRPRRCCLDASKLGQLTSLRMRNPREGLRDMQIDGLCAI